MHIFWVILLSLCCAYATQSEKIEFPSKDGILITADFYRTHPNDVPLIILFHQAGWSRGEYMEIAPKLNLLGFNCLAIDQRSGNEINNVKNETKARAEQAGKGTTYLDALPDMQAAYQFARDSLGCKKFILWGSSYSAALTFILAVEHQNDLLGMLAFSPGEYFEKFGKSANYITTYAKKINIPVFITSAKSEYEKWKNIFDAVPSKSKSYFLPETEGNHGSRALWTKFKDSKDYWQAVTAFLSALK